MPAPPNANSFAKLLNNLLTGVLVITKTPNKKSIAKIGIAKIVVTKATNGVDTP